MDQHGAVSGQARSSPIAIVRPASDKGNDPTGFETDDDDDDDDENSVIDVVERDAIKLRKKFGDKVVSAASYQPNMAMDDDHHHSGVASTTILSKTMLKAPYLGSLGKSEYLMQLPPISLSDDPYQTTSGGGGDPPAEITSYGSLRESHQRGKFLDGPSSYREPRSGQIRPLDNRTRYQTSASVSSSLPQPVSIGERIQQARYQQETRLKEQQLQKQVHLQGHGGVKESVGVSSLSLMMDEASKKTATSRPPDQRSALERPTKVGTIDYVPIRDTANVAPPDLSVFDPPTMLSTSLTAFEILRSSKSLTTPNYQQNHTQRFVEQQQQHTEAAAVAASTPKVDLPDKQFKPLSRSLSDPTPHHMQQTPVLAPSLQQLNTPRTHSNNNGSGWVPTFALSGMNLNQPAAAAAASVDASMLPSLYDYASAQTPVMGSQSHVTSNPDTDEAFDMDME